jgi:hypothetical protein
MTLDRLDGSWALDLDMLLKQRPRVRLQQNSGSLSCVKREWSVARTSAISAETNHHKWQNRFCHTQQIRSQHHERAGFTLCLLDRIEWPLIVQDVSAEPIKIPLQSLTCPNWMSDFLQDLTRQPPLHRWSCWCQVTVTMIGRDWLVIADRLVPLLQSYPLLLLLLLLLLFQRLTIHKASMLFSLSKVHVPQYHQNLIIEFS